MKNIKRILLAIIFIGLGYLIYDTSIKLPVVTAYAAKDVCSGIFIANRSLESLENNDINYSFMSKTSITVNKEEKSVTASIFGLFPRKAIFRDALGCCVTKGYEESELKKQAFKRPIIENIPLDTVLTDIEDEIDFEQLNTALDSIFDHEERTRGVVVLYKNKLVAERYGKGFDQSTPLLGWSMNKSIINALVGIMKKQNRLDLNDKALFKEWANDERKNIALNDLMHMSSGLDWDEGYGGLSDVTKMLYKTGKASVYAINKKFAIKPDSAWVYSSGTSNIISQYIRNKISNDEAYHNFPYLELFNKIGASSFYYETDANGTFVASSFGYATTRDWAKFGMLYLNDGMANGERILPEGWAKYSAEPAKASNGKYGAQFWVNNLSGIDEFRSVGHHGQIVSIIPSKNLVIVRLGLSINKRFNSNKFIQNVVNSIKE
ncbi:serine hydrolase [Ancylomarina sp. 16SWW S1-10-2]|uniref:serine hydrolase domain-containing protein n=1 Tax=Ancylomarina sp. 16SWW S1-10-2 TaxID=2499681 RepID=UPI00189D75A2|nr:serine hydrolase [Ancylomarina sp. 16SWW S1-10-2]